MHHQAGVNSIWISSTIAAQSKCLVVALGHLNTEIVTLNRFRSTGISERGAAFGNMNNAFADAGPSVVGNMRDCFGRSLNVLDMGSSRFGCNHNSLT